MLLAHNRHGVVQVVWSVCPTSSIGQLQRHSVSGAQSDWLLPSRLVILCLDCWALHYLIGPIALGTRSLTGWGHMYRSQAVRSVAGKEAKSLYAHHHEHKV